MDFFMRTILTGLRILILSLDLLQVSLALQSSIKNGNANLLIRLREGLSETVFVIEIFYYFFLILAAL